MYTLAHERQYCSKLQKYETNLRMNKCVMSARILEEGRTEVVWGRGQRQS